ncbi:DUF2141 domain-containing protein [Alteromonas sediminis]|uniref:DUF2141 domain-containing protein n=1 Tax=Alteromonas sediminis TaxID=2259342 RepID=A0A3N5YNC4_9ALTE|nr:DUF2141 domain-containing protein [Alteromonas sediminis]RPJ67051.1 DUF2141 domain-containing protein [Alteromonas sediminis]
MMIIPTRIFNLSKQASAALLTSVLFYCSGVSAADAVTLTLTVDNIRDDSGHVLVALYQGQEAYKTNKDAKNQMVKATKGKVDVVFEGLAPGEYAIKMFHDENDNQKLDFNVLGIPKESYGFSNNVGRFGEPDFEEARFTVGETDLSVQINLF